MNPSAFIGYFWSHVEKTNLVQSNFVLIYTNRQHRIRVSNNIFPDKCTDLKDYCDQQVELKIKSFEQNQILVHVLKINEGKAAWSRRIVATNDLFPQKFVVNVFSFHLRNLIKFTRNPMGLIR